MSKKVHQLPKPKGNPLLPKVPLTIGEVTYTLAYDFNSIAKAEELTGVNMFRSFDFSSLSVVKFRAMLYASLLKYHPKITIDEVGNLITAKNLAEITISMVQAWHGARPDVTEDEKKSTEGNVEAGAEDDDPLDINQP